jgi:protein tyrosine phosphatase (PTP) superfamily phosphohydrolase (DUF442 family)
MTPATLEASDTNLRAASGKPRKRGARLRRLVSLGLVGLFTVGAVEARRVFLGTNAHVVLPGRVYRCAQPSQKDLARQIQEHGIRTVVNLRGCSAGLPWYLEESRATAELDLAQEDICFSAGRLPSSAELRRFVEVLDKAEYPLLLHCRRGADRTGMASAIVLLLQPGRSYAEAARQLALRYGHLPVGNPTSLDEFLGFYETWLAERGLEHSPALFRRWVVQEYCPAQCRGELEWLDFPRSVARGEPFSVRVRAHNTSRGSWRFRPGVNAGVHAAYVLWDASDRQVANGKAALLDAEVPPGQSIDITIPLPSLNAPGKYRLLVDMVDEQQCWFFQVGSEPLEEELEVRE